MSFFEELKRRNVFRVGIAYVLLGWALLQGADFILDLIGAPDWVIRTLAVVVAIGLPIALFFAWAFELTPEGIKRESEIDRSQSVTPQTGRKLDRAIIVFLVLVIAMLGLERFWPAKAPSDTGASAANVSAETSSLTDEMTPARSIAVLPFLNMSPDADNEYFSDGISEEILNVLADIEDLKVASRTSAFRYKGSDLALKTIAGELGVSHVLEGSVRKAGDQVRITAQLIQASDGFHLWSETYDRELDNIFAIQDEIAGNIAQVLQVELLGDRKPYTEASDLSPKNYEKFLKASFLMRQRNDDAMEQAVMLLEDVLSDVPDFPRGLAQLAEAQVQMDRFQNEQGMVAIEALTDRALALEPDLAAAHMIKGHLAMTTHQMHDAVRQLERAIELDPSEPRPYHWLGIALANSGFLEQSREALSTAVELEPDHANANGYLGLVHLLLGDYDTALRHFERQDQLGNDFGASRRIQVLALQGEIDEAGRLIDSLDGLGTLEAQRLQLFVAAARNPERIGAFLDFVDAHEVDRWHLVMELMILEQYERALAIEWGGYPRLSWADRWAEARGLPAFDALVANANLAEYWDAVGPPPACVQTPSGYDCANGETP